QADGQAGRNDRDGSRAYQSREQGLLPVGQGPLRWAAGSPLRIHLCHGREDLMDFLQLAGKTVLVLGVANRKSVAWHVSRVLVEAGATVVYAVRSVERRQSVAKLLGPDAEIHVCDVEREE